MPSGFNYSGRDNESSGVSVNSVYISLGSNVGDRLKNIKSGILFLKKNGLKKLKISSFYISKPMYYEKQPYFINCAISARTNLSAREVLKLCKAAEKKLRRKYIVDKGPRSFDADIIYFGEDVLKEKDLEIPHFDRLRRPFVIFPLNEIAPLKKDPVCKVSLKDIAAKMRDEDIIKIPAKPRELESFLIKLKPSKKSSFGVKKIIEVLKSLGNPQKKMGRIVHITGSNGKTSTAFFLEKICRLYGFKTGVYTSPHICSFRERIRINGRPAGLCYIFKLAREIISVSPVELSYFEFLTVLAFLIFNKELTDVSIVEVGMGGKRDATNVVHPQLCVFTPITIEHKDIIGPSLKEICMEKAGIIKKNSIVISSYKNAGIPEKIFKEKCRKFKSKFIISENINSKNPQKENLDLAFLAFRSAFPKESKLKKISFSKKFSTPPARYEKVFYKGNRLLIDGAHNPQAFEKLLENNNFDCAIVAFMADKDIKNCLSYLEKNCEKIILSSSSSYRGASPYYTLSLAKDKGIYIVEPDLKKALRKAFDFGKNILVSGSLYFCADVKALLNEKKIKHPYEMIVKKDCVPKA